MGGRQWWNPFTWDEESEQKAFRDMSLGEALRKEPDYKKLAQKLALEDEKIRQDEAELRKVTQDLMNRMEQVVTPIETKWGMSNGTKMETLDDSEFLAEITGGTE